MHWNAVNEQGMKPKFKSSGGECEYHKRCDEATHVLIVALREVLVMIQG
jgi:hypothetical protein